MKNKENKKDQEFLDESQENNEDEFEEFLDDEFEDEDMSDKKSSQQ